MNKLRLRLSGTFDARLESHQKQLNSFRTAKARALLAYLAMEPNIPHSRQALSTLFWPDLNEKAASSNFRNTLSNFRRLFKPLPNLLTITRHTIELHSDYVWVDVLEFSNHPSLETIDHYKGDFLPGLNLYDAIAFEEWRTVQQERLHMLALLTLDSLIETQKSDGEYSLAIDLVHKQLSIEPWHEKGHAQLIRLLWEQGQRELALQQYEQCQNILADELGIAPSVELQTLIEEIKQGSQAITPSPKQIKHNLPQQTHPFIGRQSEIEEIINELDQTSPPLLTLVGTGGAGKSRLALEVARRYLTRPERYPDGVFIISLAPLDDAGAIPLAVGEAVGYSFFEGSSFRDQILEFLSTQSALLIFDNVEHLIDDGAVFIRDFIAAAPQCQILATSRQLIDLAGESVYRLDGLAFAKKDRAIKNDLEDAEQLYILSAKRVSKSFSPTQAEMDAIWRICQLVEGLPLAIVLAAGWINSLSAQEIADEIERDIGFLSTNQIDLPPRQRSMQATFAHTWWLLGNDERATYARLSVFRGGFSRRAAEAVTGASLRQLARLVSKSLLTYDPIRNRYFIHELLRQVSEGQLGEFGGETVTIVRNTHMVYYLDEVAARKNWFQGEKQQQAISDIAADFANVRSAWRWAIQQQMFDSLSNVLESLFLFFFTSGREQDGVQEFSRALDNLPQIGSDKLTKLRGRLNNRLFELTHLYKLPSSDLIQPLKQLFSHPKNDLELAILMHQEAVMALQQFDMKRGIELFEKQAGVHRSQQNNFRLGATLTNLGQLYFIAGDIKNGQKTTHAALQLGRENGDRLTTALSLVILGAADFFWIGDIESAKMRFLQVEEIGQEIRTGGQVITGFILSKIYLSFINLLVGDTDLANDYQAQALALWVEKKTPLVNALICGLDSLMALAEGRYTYALDTALKGVSWSKRPGAIELNQIALVNSACMLWETDHAFSVLSDIWISTIQNQHLPKRSLLYYFCPAMAHVLAQSNQHELAVLIWASAQSQPNYPHTFFNNFELTQRTSMQCKTRLGEAKYQSIFNQGRSTDFAQLTVHVLDYLLSSAKQFA